MKISSSRTALATVALALVLAASACGDDDDETAETVAPAATSPTADSTGAAAESGSVVAVADTSLGPVLVDGEGMTLYAFVPDAGGPSTCAGECLANWPALAGPATAGDGVDASLLATAPGTDGVEQATYNGWPLYRFGGDSAAGDVNGQGVGDKWYAVDASGEFVGAEDGAKPAGSGASGY